jgi:organic hydroperoxide reductase OsmC/OhrA
MPAEKNKHLFEVRLDWMSKKNGLLSAPEVEGTIHVSTPPIFGGEGKPWTPEHFFLSAISSCFMTTFLAFADKLKFRISGLECSITGCVGPEEGKYRFSSIELYPKIYIESEEVRQKAAIALEKTHKYCIVSDSIKTPITYHEEIIIDYPRNVNTPILEVSKPEYSML